MAAEEKIGSRVQDRAISFRVNCSTHSNFRVCLRVFCLSVFQLIFQLGRSVADGAPATPGTRPENPTNLYRDAGPGPESVTWLVPAAGIPEGYYTLRVEGHRRGQNLHHAFHQVRTYIAR